MIVIGRTVVNTQIIPMVAGPQLRAGPIRLQCSAGDIEVMTHSAVTDNADSFQWPVRGDMYLKLKLVRLTDHAAHGPAIESKVNHNAVAHGGITTVAAQCVDQRFARQVRRPHRQQGAAQTRHRPMTVTGAAETDPKPRIEMIVCT